MREGTRFVGYVRVSTEDQAQHGVSLEAQSDQLRAYASARGLDLAEVVVDAGKSAGTLDRPGMRRVLALLDSGEAGGVLVHKFDRLTRRVADAARLLDVYFPAGRETLLITVAEGLDTKTPAGRMVCFMLAAVAQYEREATAARNETALAHKRARGEQLGHVPFGSRLADDGSTLVPCPEDLATWAQIRAMSRVGRSTREIAAALTDLGIPTKRGRARWAHSTVAAILRHPPTAV